MQRKLGCGGRPSYGPIPRNARIWQAGIERRRCWRLDNFVIVYRREYKILYGCIIYEPAWWKKCGEKIAIAEDAGMKRFITYYKKDAKRCGDFDNSASTDVYICLNCIDNLQKRQDFLDKYDELLQEKKQLLIQKQQP
jgi:hypothetical protein